MSSAARQVLVLGPAPISELIAKQFHELGFEASIQPEVPPPTHPQSINELKAILQRFSQHAAGSERMLHPGVSSWAERPELHAVAESAGMELVAPSSRTVALFADKLTFLSSAAELGVPNLVLGAEQGPLLSVREIEKFLLKREKAVGLPVIIRSARGSGPFGCFALHHLSQLEKEFPLWLEQHRLNFGEPILFIERYQEACRRIALPFCRFASGAMEFFPTVDGSLQARFRKVVEFCPSDIEETSLAQKLKDDCAAIAEMSGFVGVGSLEFVVEGEKRYLTEGSARLNASFHLWEQVAGTSAVDWQLAALEGRGDEDYPVLAPEKEWTSAIALRVLAEDSLLHLPQPGVVHEISPSRYWRVAGAVAELFVGAHSGEEPRNPLAALAFVGGLDRKRVLTMTRGVLDEIWIAGALQTNERFLAELVTHPWVKEGIFHAGFVDEEFLPALRPPVEIALAAVGAVRAIDPEPSDWVAGDRRVSGENLERAVCPWAGEPARFQHEIREGISGAIQLKDGRKIRLCAFPISSKRWQVRIGPWFMMVKAPRKGAPAVIASLVPGRVHSILIREGGTVPAHRPALVIETMGHLVPHALPKEVVIEHWKVKPDQWVKAGEELADFSIAPSDTPSKT